jgi:hypothetical protein
MQENGGLLFQMTVGQSIAPLEAGSFYMCEKQFILGAAGCDCDEEFGKTKTGPGVNRPQT